jgi:hypothetical protein
VALLLTLVTGLVSGLLFGLVFGLEFALRVPSGRGPGLRFALEFGLVNGLVAGLVTGFTLAWVKTMWPSYTSARGRLALRGRLPGRLMDFLADAYRRGVLRQVDAVYQFRHIELQHRLANRDANGKQASS